jgi:hypothetical protein
LLSSGTLHPSIIITGWLDSVASVGGDAGSRFSVGAAATKAAPVTKFRRSIILRPVLLDFSIDVFAVRIA